MKSLYISTVPRDFRENDAPSFKELADIIYSLPNIEYCSVDELGANSSDLNQFIMNKYGCNPKAIIIYEALIDKKVQEIISNLNVHVIFITEDLHLRSINALKSALKCSNTVLSRFNIINDLVDASETNHLNIESFPLHCSEKFLNNPISHESQRVLNFGQIYCKPPNVNPEKCPADANQYELRKRWHDLFMRHYNDKYEYIRSSPNDLSQRMKGFSMGFACSYFPYSFSEKCRIEQGEAWTSHNMPLRQPSAYLVAKFFEIPGAGLLLLADPTGVEAFLEKEGFVDKVNYISITFDNHAEIMAYLFDKSSQEEIHQIRLNGNLLIRQSHLIFHRKALLRDIMMRIDQI